MYETHILIDELQTSSIFKENETVTAENCNFIDPYLMNGDIVIDKVITRNSTPSRTPTNSLRGKLLMIETNQEEIVDSENPKFQYVFDNLREEFKQQLNELSKLSCQNRHNLLSLIECFSHSSPTLAAELILQRNDIIAKRINGNLLIAPCNPKKLKTKVVEFKGGIINKFEVERIDAELEILSQQHPNIDYIINRPKKEIWHEINNGGVELSQQIEIGFYKAL
ncbi:unnamed protein product [Onchocerca ochengi]|uniref:Protein kinase domain-containing protein n=1 Tax=Onchocerca ochengi TaxID=42157 RepID=A0A182EUQ5_ONCOC|nr:unnamed protein product [Onchocerca ochengi]